VIDAYLGSHHDAPITEEDEQQRLAASEAELASEIAANEEKS
jgi:branched-chain amino acid transport system ATP-binding protein